MADKNNSDKYFNLRQKKENDLKDEMINNGLNYEAPTKNEDNQSRKLRHQRMKRKLKSSQQTSTLEEKRQKTENELKRKLMAYGLIYDAPSSTEDANCRKRRVERMRYALNMYEKENNVQSSGDSTLFEPYSVRFGL